MFNYEICNKVKTSNSYGFNHDISDQSTKFGELIMWSNFRKVLPLNDPLVPSGAQKENIQLQL